MEPEFSCASRKAEWIHPNEFHPHIQSFDDCLPSADTCQESNLSRSWAEKRGGVCPAVGGSGMAGWWAGVPRRPEGAPTKVD